MIIDWIKQIIFARKYRRAVRQAKNLAELTGLRYWVISLNGELKVVPKKTIKELVRKRRFRKGVTVDEIEKRALYITQ